MAVPGLFQRPPNSRAPSPVKAFLACFRLVIRQAVSITKRFRAPAVRSGFRPRGLRSRCGRRQEETDHRAISGRVQPSRRPPRRLKQIHASSKIAAMRSGRSDSSGVSLRETLRRARVRSGIPIVAASRDKASPLRDSNFCNVLKEKPRSSSLNEFGGIGRGQAQSATAQSVPRAVGVNVPRPGSSGRPVLAQH